MKILDGKRVQELHKAKIIEKIKASQKVPTLAIIQIGDDERSNLYIKMKKKFGQLIGARVIHQKLAKGITFDDLEKEIDLLNKDQEIDGIIVQLPVPEHLDPEKIVNLISPEKDVDGLNLKTKFTPATARGIVTLLDYYSIEIKGKKATVIGRSKLVGGPIAKVLEERGARVTVCHRGTENIPEKARNADILVAAAGSPHLVGKDHVREGQVVVDVGINPREEGVCGDVEFEEVSKIVEWISPVPKGVGPMTVLSLFENLMDACNN